MQRLRARGADRRIRLRCDARLHARLRRADPAMPEKGWSAAYFSRPPHGEVAGKTLGLVGLGHIGSAVAHRAKAFGYDRDGGDRAGAANAPTTSTGSPPSDRLGELLERSDYVVLACPLSETTRGLISARELKRMKPTALLVNAARAEIAVEEDLFRRAEERGDRRSGARHLVPLSGLAGGAGRAVALSVRPSCPTCASRRIPPAGRTVSGLAAPPSLRRTLPG